MGHPTSSLGQRINRSQLAEHVPVLNIYERGHGEHLFRLNLGAQLAILACQTAFVPTTGAVWVRQLRTFR